MRILCLSSALVLAGVASAQVTSTQSAGPQQPAARQLFPRLLRIADTQTPVPGGSGTFSIFADARAIEGGAVAFIGLSGSDTGIYTFENGVLDVLVDENTTVPGTVATFSTFFDVALDGGVVAFTGGWPGPGGGCSFSGSEGLFEVDFDGGAISVIVDSLTTTSNCFHGVDSNLGLTAVCGGINSVDAIHNHSETIFTTAGGPLSVLADLTTASPSGGTFVGFDQEVVLQGSNYLFAEILPNTIGAVAGLYLDQGQGLQLLADGSTAVPSGTGVFDNFAGFDYDGNEAAFMGRSSSGTALYAGTSPASLQRVVDNTTSVPGESFNFLGVANPVAIEGGAIGFSGYWGGGGYGLFVAEGGLVEPIVKKGDVLDGALVEQAYCRAQNMSGSRMLIEVRFQSTPVLSHRALYLVTR